MHNPPEILKNPLNRPFWAVFHQDQVCPDLHSIANLQFVAPIALRTRAAFSSTQSQQRTPCLQRPLRKIAPTRYRRKTAAIPKRKK